MRATWKLMMALAVVAAIASVGAFLIVRALVQTDAPALAQTPQPAPISLNDWMAANQQAAAQVKDKPPAETTLNGITFTGNTERYAAAILEKGDCQPEDTAEVPFEQAATYGLDEQSLIPTYLPEGAQQTNSYLIVCSTNNKVIRAGLRYGFPGYPYMIFISWEIAPVANSRYPEDMLQATSISSRPAVSATAFDNAVHVLLADGSMLIVGGFGQFPMDEVIKIAESIPAITGQ